jgi:hypothetical protein
MEKLAVGVGVEPFMTSLITADRPGRGDASACLLSFDAPRDDQRLTIC